MTKPAVGRSIFDLANLAVLPPRLTQVNAKLPPSSSFRYHVPRRIATTRTTSSTLSIHDDRTSFAVSRSTTLARSSVSTISQPANNAALSLKAHSVTDKRSLPRRTLLPTSIQRVFRSSKALRPGGIGWQCSTRLFSNGVARTKDGGPGKQKPNPAVEKDVSKSTSGTPDPDSTSSENEHTLMERLHIPQFNRPHIPQFHRPTKEELLAAATGFWSRLKVRFKWSTIRSVRPFNLDEITGFLSWILLGHVVWIVVGTTTFFSLAIFTINTVFAQETLAGWIGNYLTKSTGIKVVFESAVVPKWGDGVITFKKVFVSRRPGQSSASGVTKGSPEAAALEAAAKDTDPQEDTNYTQFDITINEVNVTLSFAKWFNSKGLLHNVEVKGVRGVVDRTSVHWTGEILDPKSYRHEHNPGDFEIDSFKIEDLLVTVHQPKGFRPFPVSIYNADLPQLRKRYLFYDLLSANSMSGEIDKSLFTIHPRQLHAYTGAKLTAREEADQKQTWKKQSRIRIDGLNIDHLNRGTEGPFSWIYEGNVDIVADVMFPADNDESVLKVVSGFYDRMEAAVTAKSNNSAIDDPGDPDTPEFGGTVATFTPVIDAQEDKRLLIMDLKVHLNDVRASVPLFNRDLSYVNNALIRPIVAYINSRRTFIPINCRVVKKVTDFDGSWTVFDSGLMDDLSAEVYDAFARDVVDDQARMRRFKQVGLWSLQVAAQAIFLTLAGNIA